MNQRVTYKAPLNIVMNVQCRRFQQKQSWKAEFLAVSQCPQVIEHSLGGNSITKMWQFESCNPYTGWSRKNGTAYYFRSLPIYTTHTARWGNFLEDKWAKDHPIRWSSSHSMPNFLQQSRGSIWSAFSRYAMIINSFQSRVIGRVPIYSPDFVEEKLE